MIVVFGVTFSVVGGLVASGRMEDSNLLNSCEIAGFTGVSIFLAACGGAGGALSGILIDGVNGLANGLSFLAAGCSAFEGGVVPAFLTGAAFVVGGVTTLFSSALGRSGLLVTGLLFGSGFFSSALLSTVAFWSVVGDLVVTGFFALSTFEMIGVRILSFVSFFKGDSIGSILDLLGARGESLGGGVLLMTNGVSGSLTGVVSMLVEVDGTASLGWLLGCMELTDSVSIAVSELSSNFSFAINDFSYLASTKLPPGPLVGASLSTPNPKNEKLLPELVNLSPRTESSDV